MRRLFTIKKLSIIGVAALVGGTGTLHVLPKIFENYHLRQQLNRQTLNDVEIKACTSPLPTREEQVKLLGEKEYDILIIGGGATGCGIALDAISRGLSVSLVEKLDFSSGTSSRSTKLIHGGVRYLQKAVFQLDIDQYRMVKEALSERAHLIHVAPHLAQPLPIMLPLYKLWQIPYYWSGIKLYDLVSGTKILKASYFLNKSRALEQFPMLNKNELVGALVYYDGQQEDSRMNLSLALTAARLGAVVTNYTEVKALQHNEKGELCGADVLDKETKQIIKVRAKCIINATGPFTDHIRILDNQKVEKICAPSSGIHIILPGYYSPKNMGLLDPSTKDGRVIFFLPWQGSTMAGTTDNACEITDSPSPTEAEIQFILGEVRHYLASDIKVRRGDVLSAWAGIRPLVRDPNKADTQSIARNHVMEVSKSGLITMAGGKWTTYRKMAEETVDEAVRRHKLNPIRACMTEDLRIEGAHNYTNNLFIQLSQDFGVEPMVAEYLAHNYGDRAVEVIQLSNLTGKRWPVIGKRLHPDYPYLEAEVTYACREYARSVIDVVARRTRLAFLNVHAAEEVLPTVVEMMAKELKWDKARQKEELAAAKNFLIQEMGLELKNQTLNVPLNFTADETNFLIKRFHSIDSDKKGFISVRDLRAHFEKTKEPIDDDQITDILNEVDTNRNGEIDLTEYLQFMSSLKTGAVSNTRFQHIVNRSGISIERSGGGV